MMIQDFNIKVNVMPWHDYICHAHHEHGNLAKIVHFGCHDKVWTDDRYLRTYPEWFRTHMQWLELGGEDFDRTNMSMRGIWAEIYGNQSHSTETVPRHWKAEEYSRSKVDRMRLMLFGIPSSREPGLMTAMHSNSSVSHFAASPIATTASSSTH